MFKYIVKRLLISVIILLGVSIIIYTMVRLMPTDYVDVKYASQLQNGTITQADVDNFKKLYGLDVSEAFMTIKTEGGNVDGKTFTRSINSATYKELTEKVANDETFYGTYSENTNSVAKYYIQLKEQNSVSSYRIYHYTGEKKTVTKEDPITGEKVEVEVDVIEDVDSGAYRVEYSGDEENRVLTLVFDGSGINPVVTQRKATSGEKASSIFRGYFNWIGKLFRGDLGTSFKYELPVGTVIAKYMWISFAIAVIATILQFLIAIPLGISSATHQYSVRDYTVTVFTMIGISLPTYFFAAIVVKIFSVDLGWFPPSGLIYANADYANTFAGTMTKLGDMIMHLILPIFVSVILSLGGLMRYTRTNTLEVLSADYIRTARAKGLSEHKVIYKHAFRNTLIPLATLLAGILPSLFGGMMITEQVFAIPGIGNLAYKALKDGDIPFIMGYNMFLAILTVIGTLLSDIMYSIVDPRVKLGK